MVWSDQCEETFKTLKSILYPKLVLRGPELHQNFRVTNRSASDLGVGGVLSQKDDSGEEHSIVHFSSKLLPREEKYSVIEKECLAIKLAYQTFQVYLLGRHFEIHWNRSIN